MNAQDIARLFELDAHVAAKNTAGMDHAQSLIRAGEGSSANWVLGHVVATRNSMFQLVGLDPFWSQERTRQYDRGSAVPDQDAAPFEEILQAHRSSQEQLRSFLREVSADDLARPLPKGTDAVLGSTLGEALMAFAWHEGYHLGQLGTLRRVAGMDGAVA
jgi:uncharacterized damage-inducible protein DinB